MDDDHPNTENPDQDLRDLDDLIKSAVEKALGESSINDELPELPKESSEFPEPFHWPDVSSESAVLGKRDPGGLDLGSGTSVSELVETTHAISGGTDARGAISNPSPVGIPFFLVPVVLLVILKGMFPGNGGRFHARQFKK